MKSSQPKQDSSSSRNSFFFFFFLLYIWQTSPSPYICYKHLGSNHFIIVFITIPFIFVIVRHIKTMGFCFVFYSSATYISFNPIFIFMIALTWWKNTTKQKDPVHTEYRKCIRNTFFFFMIIASFFFFFISEAAAGQSSLHFFFVCFLPQYNIVSSTWLGQLGLRTLRPHWSDREGGLGGAVTSSPPPGCHSVRQCDWLICPVITALKTQDAIDSMTDFFFGCCFSKNWNGNVIFWEKKWMKWWIASVQEKKKHGW